MPSLKIVAELDSSSPYPSGTTPQDILTKGALDFVVSLHRTFNNRRKKLLETRVKRQVEIDGGKLPSFLEETKHIREDIAWQGPVPAPGLVDRRVEITGPPDRKMIVNAFNSNVTTYMTDFEDSMAPTWTNVIWGQANLYDAVRGQLDFVAKDTGKEYKVKDANTHFNGKLPTLIVRPRGWHMVEKHIVVDGEPISASIFDFGIFFYHNAKALIAKGHGPYFYLPKMEAYQEARLWNDIFNVAQDTLEIPRGTIRATVLIETLTGAFELEEIIYELRQHSSGLNCGRWDYMFSTIKKLRHYKDKVLPDRGDVTMTVPFMAAYVKYLIEVCHKRGVHAMGGMAAQIPIKGDEAANAAAMERVKADKLREATAGHDGTWVAHPALAHIATDIFGEYMPHPNQLFYRPELDKDGYLPVETGDLLNTQITGGKITEAGIRKNIYIGLNYMEAWLRGVGCVPIDWLMEDAATAEVSRAQLNQWVLHGVKTEDTDKVITAELNKDILAEETAKLLKTAKEGNKFELAAKYFLPEITGEKFSDFLTTLLYDELTAGESFGEILVEALKA
ncbi:uncharacterized protein SAPINGB_P006319 [Magnusiomyces paraingens]|uniref:Malate synthase n=1 Tax=Magnusiomyces paraingens TaxID=2606893 RepID=A0A5E8C9H5_9ASCO|nr:uncharacterized protein SAPINGB_P006319 [Saprochaete ingens]VVT58658.1 unnamed protein product [Saprochaete ingens]